jgi:hypothetical protein
MIMIIMYARAFWPYPRIKPVTEYPYNSTGIL